MRTQTSRKPMSQKPWDAVLDPVNDGEQSERLAAFNLIDNYINISRLYSPLCLSHASGAMRDTMSTL